MEILPESLKKTFDRQIEEMAAIARRELHEEAPSMEELQLAYTIWLEESIGVLIGESMPRICGRNRNEFNSYAFEQALAYVENLRSQAA